MGEVCQVCQSSYFGRQHVNAHPAFKLLPGCTCHNHDLKAGAGKFAGALFGAAREAAAAAAASVDSVKKFAGIPNKPKKPTLSDVEASNRASEQSERASEQSK